MKTIVAALAGASLLATALPAAAESAHHGGFGRSSAAGAPGFGGRTGFGSGRFGFRGGGRFCCFGGPFFGLGLAVGLAAYDPWWFDSPYYGYYGYGYYGPYPPYGAYPPPPPGGYYPPPNGAGPPPGAPPMAGPQNAPGASAPAACGSWSWDAGKQAYNWVPCNGA